MAAQALENGGLLGKFLRLTVDDVLVYAGLCAVFERGQRLVAESGEFGAGACSSVWEEETQERGCTVSGRRLAAEGRSHPASSGGRSGLWGITDYGVGLGRGCAVDSS